jgi:hypothetical protein
VKWTDSKKTSGTEDAEEHIVRDLGGKAVVDLADGLEIGLAAADEGTRADSSTAEKSELALIWRFRGQQQGDRPWGTVERKTDGSLSVLRLRWVEGLILAAREVCASNRRPNYDGSDSAD